MVFFHGRVWWCGIWSICLLPRSLARTWSDVKEFPANEDVGGAAYMQRVEEELRLRSFLLDDGKITSSTAPSGAANASMTTAPSPAPSTSPSIVPSQTPSADPSRRPSSQPSLTPSVSPARSFKPSASPSRRTLAPSESPSESPIEAEPFPPISLPDKTERGYFNYDTSSDYGPNKWGSVSIPNPYYWSEFDRNGFGVWKGVLQNRKLNENMCSNGEYQSPIDVRENGAQCDEFHEIRDNAGEFSVSDRDVKKLIESNKLRLVYPRRPCPDLKDPKCLKPHDLPLADFPNGWPKTADVLHIDFKIPAEHTIHGEVFDAEMQIFHIHARNQRIALLSTLIRARVDGFNAHFQQALSAFQNVYNANLVACNNKKARRVTGMEEIATNSTDFLARSFIPVANASASVPPVDRLRDLQGDVWNPYHKLLIPTIHFYRYDGSLTEPPCGEFVSWFISDKPMIMSFEQLEQWRKIQFTNVGPDCRKTSVHEDSQSGAARPLQPTKNRPVWKCTPQDFGPDP